jgi:hypothetical protein
MMVDMIEAAFNVAFNDPGVGEAVLPTIVRLLWGTDCPADML